MFVTRRKTTGLSRLISLSTQSAWPPSEQGKPLVLVPKLPTRLSNHSLLSAIYPQTQYHSLGLGAMAMADTMVEGPEAMPPQILPQVVAAVVPLDSKFPGNTEPLLMLSPGRQPQYWSTSDQCNFLPLNFSSLYMLPSLHPPTSQLSDAMDLISRYRRVLITAIPAIRLICR